jgi:hypothetical protein
MLIWILYPSFNIASKYHHSIKLNEFESWNASSLSSISSGEKIKPFGTIS